MLPLPLAGSYEFSWRTNTVLEIKTAYLVLGFKALERELFFPPICLCGGSVDESGRSHQYESSGKSWGKARKQGAMHVCIRWGPLSFHLENGINGAHHIPSAHSCSTSQMPTQTSLLHVSVSAVTYMSVKIKTQACEMFRSAASDASLTTSDVRQKSPTSARVNRRSRLFLWNKADCYFRSVLYSKEPERSSKPARWSRFPWHYLLLKFREPSALTCNI